MLSEYTSAANNSNTIMTTIIYQCTMNLLKSSYNILEARMIVILESDKMFL